MQVCDSSFYDFNNDQKLEGQLAYTQFNGKQVTLYTTMENVTKSLEKEGWTPDYRYQADGPTGTASDLLKAIYYVLYRNRGIRHKMCRCQKIHLYR